MNTYEGYLSETETVFSWFNSVFSNLPPVDKVRISVASREVEAGLLAKHCLDNLDISVATRREFSELSAVAKAGEEAWSWLIVSNLRLVFQYSKGVANSLDSHWAQDAFQAGVIGLVKGLQKWDYRLGHQLSTYIVWHIRQQIQRWRANEVRLVRIPVHVLEKVASSSTTLDSSTLDRVEKLAAIEPLHVLVDVVQCDGGIEEFEEELDRGRLLSMLFSVLSEQEIDILKRRYGFYSGDPETLDAIGVSYDLTRERIRQIASKAIDKMREAVTEFAV